jgi:hypothetical protein
MQTKAQIKFGATPVIISIAFGMVLSAGIISSNTANAQQVPSKKTSTSTIHSIKMTSPAKGQQVRVGTPLTVIGTSLDNATSSCQVSVIVNSIKPYQPAAGTGHGGATDYSSWHFVLSAATIKPGQNKITAKYSCSNNPTSLSYYSVNVTGVEMGDAVTAKPTTTTAKPTTTTAKPTTTTTTTTTTTNITLKLQPPSTTSPTIDSRVDEVKQKAWE